MKGMALFAVFILVSLSVGAEVHWTDSYDYNTHDELIGICAGYGDGFLAVGGSWNTDRFYAEQLLLRYDGQGNVDWMAAYRTGAGTFAFDACQIRESNEFMVVGTSDWAPGYTPDVMLSRYDDNGNRLEKQIYENYGIGTSIARTRDGDYVIGAVDSGGYLLIMMVDGDDLSNILWTYTGYSPIEVADNWMRVYVEVTPNDEIVYGVTLEANFYQQHYYQSTIVEILNINGIRTGYIGLSGYSPMSCSSILTGIDTGRSVNGTTPIVFSGLYEYVGWDTFIASFNITNGTASASTFASCIDSRANNCFNNGLFSTTEGTVFSCVWNSTNSAWIYGYSDTSDSNPFIQKFGYPSSSLLSERVHQGSESIIRGPEFHLGDGDRVGVSAHAIAQTVGSGTSSDCFVEYWKFDTGGGITALASETDSMELLILSNASTSPSISFEAKGDGYSIDVYDLSGRLVLSDFGSTSAGDRVNVAICNTSPLASGSYLVRVTTGDQIEAARFAIVR